jgi:hypothetical protein
MNKSNVSANPAKAALLCLGDTSTAEGALVLSPLYGQPLLHHVVKQLQAVGIERFFISVDSLPGALLSYRDKVASAGLQVEFVRDATDFADKVGTDCTILLLRAEAIWSPTLIEQALVQTAPFIATVDERPENAAFERIDLNHRWAGLAIIEAKTAHAIAQMPDGWDLASAIMRQAVQDGARFWPVRQADLDAGSVLHMQTADELATAKLHLTPEAADTARNLDNLILAKPVSALTTRLWNVEWGRGAALAIFPALSILALLFAVLQLPLSASVTGFLAVITSYVRKSVRIVEYRADVTDREATASWVALGSALLMLLIFIEFALFEAIFIGGLLIGLMILGAAERRRFVIASPLVVAIALLSGIAAGAESFILRVIILSEIAFMAWHLWRAPNSLSEPEQA